MAGDFSCALLLLAAGASKRMGRPKQLLPVGGRPLLRHVAENLLATPVSPVSVVLGANAAEIAPCLDGLPLRVVVNAGWARGMGSSLRTGLQALLDAAPATTSVIVALADQPDCPADHLGRLIATRRQTGRTIVASLAGGVLCPPVLFTAEWFPRLLALEGEAGARNLLQEQRAAVATVPLPVATDLDTPDDYARFLRDPGSSAP
ncbi:nucleotidyltransferase family protein [Opitutus sp. GAS368]|jgi:molybdenum cofactor cytidylyltransferase|uniref:nucleotidyltransferase family protein n=1 Tax=Opitutus sp. GAS368 TaxID=1882749 RepID=UPI00087C63E3|nr:nucleotidyltransferase family protein [Opitutus sp. GAS368]SDS19576.1 molybdenum cofactor cytidylyltransferase [Opitutus sp. GAS368]